MSTRTNYLENDFLKKCIAESKLTFCSIPAEENVTHYDAIVMSLSEITPELVQETIQKKAEADGINPDDIMMSDLVFRVYDNEHCELPNKNLPFPPFKHYVSRNGVWKEVLRSHWKGTIEDGQFCHNHGALSIDLMDAFVLLCRKISHKPNYRSYTYLDDMKSEAIAHLLEVGLKFDESKNTSAFSYYTTIVDRCFKNTLGFEKKQRDIKNHLRMDGGMSPSHSYAIDYELGFREE